jgi:hypothetical protein
LWTLGDLGEALHQATGLEMIADSFVRARLDSQAFAVKRPVVQMMDQVSNDLRYRWRKEGNLLLLRSQIYFRDRPAEVPERVLAPWRQVATAGAPTLDSTALLAAALTESQARGMHEFWGWYLEGTPVATSKWSEEFFRSRYHLRMWASLTAQQRRVALDHATIPVAQMLLPQRQAFVQALTARDETVWGPMRIPEPLPAADVAAGGFSLDIHAFQEQKFRIGFSSGNYAEFSQIVGTGERAFSAKPGDRGPFPEPAGPPVWYDGYNFSYYLAGQEKPVLKVPLNLPRREPAH